MLRKVYMGITIQLLGQFVKTKKLHHISLIFFSKTDKREGISISCSLYIFLIAVQMQVGNGGERGRGLEDYCDIFVDKYDNTFRRDWRLWYLLVLYKLITVHRSGSSLHSICHRTRLSCGMFSVNRTAALPIIFFKKPKVLKMPPEAGAHCIGWHIFVQCFWQEAATESQKKDEVILYYRWHGGGGKHIADFLLPADGRKRRREQTTERIWRTHCSELGKFSL